MGQRIIFYLLLVLLASCREEQPSVVDRTYLQESYFLPSGIDLDIYFPDDYDDDHQYPIIYFNDGDGFANVFTTMTESKDEEILAEPFILVGLHAGQNRLNRYIPYSDPWITQNWGQYSPLAESYSENVIKKVLPFVEGRFNIDEERRAIFGISLGGLQATWMSMKYPETFKFSAGLSPSFWVDEYAILSESTRGITDSNRFYFDVGTKEWNYYIPLIATLQYAGLDYGEEIFYYEVENAAHNSFDWSDRIHIPFKIFLTQPGENTIVGYNLINECIPSQSVSGRFFQKLNPIVEFRNGITYSLITEASYRIIQGLGTIASDGRYTVDSETMTVLVEFGDWSEEIILQNCVN